MQSGDSASFHFLSAMAEVLGAEHALSPDQLAGRYGSTTTGVPLKAAGAVLPQHIAEVQQVVRAAAGAGVALYPVSAGNNWGYGGATPTDGNAVILDLRRLTAIDGDNLDLGVVTVEPGVTQAMLRDYLDARELGMHESRYMVPVHGGGPQCSLLGNALERGYGITPITDHFAAVMRFTAVLPDGELYRTPLSEQGAATDALFKWGVGPYLDGLFTQGAFGIVVNATIALAPLPSHVESFLFRIRRPADAGAAAEAVRDIVKALPGVVHGVNLMNARRMISMMLPYPTELVGPDGTVPQAAIDSLARRHNIAAWTGFGALYGDKAVVKAARRRIRKRLRGIAGRPVFIPHGMVRWTARQLERMPAAWLAGPRLYLKTLLKSLSVVEGAPAEIALPLAYWKQGGVGDRVGLHPARDRCGLIWYAPLVPARRTAVTSYVAMAEATCRRFGIEPLMTLTSVSERCFDSTVPILFNVDDLAEVERAQQCYRALLAEGRKLGFMPYRYPSHEMAALVDADQPYWRLVHTLKAAVDPAQIIAPGRYHR